MPGRADTESSRPVVVVSVSVSPTEYEHTADGAQQEESILASLQFRTVDPSSQNTATGLTASQSGLSFGVLEATAAATSKQQRQHRERRTSQLSASSTATSTSSNSRIGSGRFSPSSLNPSPATTAIAHATARFTAAATGSNTASKMSASMLQGIEAAQLHIPPFRGGPHAQRTHYPVSASTAAAASTPMVAGQRAATAAATATADLGRVHQLQPAMHASYAAHPGPGSGMLTPPSSSAGLPQLPQPHLYLSHQPSNSAQYAHTPSHRQGAPLPPGVVTSAATTSAATSAGAGASNRNRASHQIMTVASAAAAAAASGAGYGHASPPVSIALHTAQYNVPGQRKVCFGDYQLLHTLGEGEFGKVKLGVHKHRWGEEVAIKLIKKGSIENSARSMKVQREIEVLKMVKHPHIVRLHEVVETDRFIGIVLEYASGGELFEYILAHKHLRETMACKLFAQLISGVAYLHSKKIVHRDLKLENLLLDRNKDIVITDFGFANRFNESGQDLMATSCGSPCYAAPELVLQDGQYVGSAVDVWSCGVILYAMLSGYLPYDDDPANPDGDNINLLYRYITTTRLSFPEWISPEPRELLLMMLVADPDKRCRLEDVMRHPWLRRYSSFFQNTVPDLEMQAEAQYEEKRRLLARQQEHYFRSTGQALPPHLQRSQSSMAGFEGQQPILGQNSSSSTTAQQRHRSAMVHSVTTQSMIPEFSAVHSQQQQQFQQPRPSLPTHLLPHAATSGLISPPLSPSSTSLGESTNRHSSPFTLQPPASAYPHIHFSDPFAASSNGVTGNAPSSPLRQQQQQQQMTSSRGCCCL